MSRKLAGLQVKHLDFTVPSLLPSSPILFQGKPHFNEGLRAQAFCSLFFGQTSAKWRWIIFAIFLFCKGRDPGRPWGKEVREFNYLLILPLSPYFCSFFLKNCTLVPSSLTGRLASLPHLTALLDAFLATPIPGGTTFTLQVCPIITEDE